MDFSDERWTGLKGLYGTVYDPREALRAIEFGQNQPSAWAELWDELHHQGDVGDASFASVVVIARLLTLGKVNDWNGYALAATIETARLEKTQNVPAWLFEGYGTAWRQLYDAGITALEKATDEALICSIMAVLALHKSMPMLARMAILSESERLDMLTEVSWG